MLRQFAIARVARSSMLFATALLWRFHIKQLVSVLLRIYFDCPKSSTDAFWDTTNPIVSEHFRVRLAICSML
jgi:hypothetical protein